jgi:hypothetical protein
MMKTINENSGSVTLVEILSLLKKIPRNSSKMFDNQVISFRSLHEGICGENDHNGARMIHREYPNGDQTIRKKDQRTSIERGHSIGKESEGRFRPTDVAKGGAQQSAEARERYREISLKGHERRRVDSTEGVKRAGNAEARIEREQGSRQEVRTNKPKERLNRKETKYKSDLICEYLINDIFNQESKLYV